MNDKQAILIVIRAAPGISLQLLTERYPDLIVHTYVCKNLKIKMPKI